MPFHKKFIGNMYMFTVFPFTEVYSSLTKRGSCGISALATYVALVGFALMGLGAFGGWALGLPPYLTFLTFPVLGSLTGAVLLDTTI